MKKILSLALTLLLLISAMPLGFSVAAETVTDGCTWKLNGTVLTISGDGEMKDYSWDGGPWGTDITSVVIEDGVKAIGSHAFHNCRKLTSITIPSSVTRIGDYAFYDCRSLTDITVPDGVTSIGYSAFNNCTTLASLAISKSVTYIGSFAFFNCPELTNITVAAENAVYHSVEN